MSKTTGVVIVVVAMICAVTITDLYDRHLTNKLVQIKLNCSKGFSNAVF